MHRPQVSGVAGSAEVLRKDGRGRAQWGLVGKRTVKAAINLAARAEEGARRARANGVRGAGSAGGGRPGTEGARPFAARASLHQVARSRRHFSLAANGQRTSAARREVQRGRLPLAAPPSLPALGCAVFGPGGESPDALFVMGRNFWYGM
jgi:hypothetical protein